MVRASIEKQGVVVQIRLSYTDNTVLVGFALLLGAKLGNSLEK